jgi:hypothetical protein
MLLVQTANASMADIKVLTDEVRRIVSAPYAVSLKVRGLESQQCFLHMEHSITIISVAVILAVHGSLILITSP